MQNQDIREYFSRIGIQKITRLDTALLEAFGKEEAALRDGRYGVPPPPGGACGVYEPEPEDEPSGGFLL